MNNLEQIPCNEKPSHPLQKFITSVQSAVHSLSFLQKETLQGEALQAYQILDAILKTMNDIQEQSEVSTKGFGAYYKVFFDAKKFVAQYQKSGELSLEASKKISTYITALIDCLYTDGMSVNHHIGSNYHNKYYRFNQPYWTKCSFGIDYETKQKISQTFFIISSNEAQNALKSFFGDIHITKNKLPEYAWEDDFVQNFNNFTSFKKAFQENSLQNTINERWNKLPLWIVIKNISPHEAKETHEIINKLGRKVFAIMQVVLGEISILECHNTDNIFHNELLSSQNHHHIHAPVSLSTLIKELNSAQLSFPFNKQWPNNQPIITKRTKEKSFNSSDIDMFFKKQYHNIQSTLSPQQKSKMQKWHISAKNDSVQHFHQKTKQHYQEFFRIQQNIPDISLTRSGTSANDAPIHALKKLLPSHSKAYIMDNWYFENQCSIKKAFKTTHNLNEAHIWNIAYANLHGDESKTSFEERRNILINEAFAVAHQNPQDSYYLIFDKTINPLYSVLTDPNLDQIPENITLIETASFSKHQRGEKNYFFGIISIFNNPKLHNEVETIIFQNGWNLFKEDIIHFPRMTKSEIIKNQNHINNLQNEFQKGFDTIMQTIPPHKRWMVHNNEFCSFIHPPIEKALDRMQPTDDTDFIYPIIKHIQQETTQNEYFLLPNLQSYLNREMGYEHNSMHNDLCNATNMIAGDSFGLNNTRSIFIQQKHTQYHKNALKVEEGDFMNLRISFGLKENPQYAKQLGEYLAQTIVRNLNNTARLEKT